MGRRPAQIRYTQGHTHAELPANTRESSNPEGVGAVTGDLEANDMVEEDVLTNQGRGTGPPRQRQMVSEVVGEPGAIGAHGWKGAGNEARARAVSAPVAEVVAGAGGIRSSDEIHVRDGTGGYDGTADNGSEGGGEAVGVARGGGGIHGDDFEGLAGEKDDDIIFTKEDVDMTSEIGGFGWMGDVSIPAPPASDDQLSASGLRRGIQPPISRDGSVSSRRVEGASALGMVGQGGGASDAHTNIQSDVSVRVFLCASVACFLHWLMFVC